MGSSFAPSIANLFMASLEDRMILNHEQNPFRSSILFYWCFIYDCFCIFKGAQNVQDFMEWLNLLHPNIRFTYESSSQSIHFLDTTVFRTKA